MCNNDCKENGKLATMGLFPLAVGALAAYGFHALVSSPTEDDGVTVWGSLGVGIVAGIGALSFLLCLFHHLDKPRSRHDRGTPISPAHLNSPLNPLTPEIVIGSTSLSSSPVTPRRTPQASGQAFSPYTI